MKDDAESRSWEPAAGESKRYSSADWLRIRLCESSSACFWERRTSSTWKEIGAGSKLCPVVEFKSGKGPNRSVRVFKQTKKPDEKVWLKTVVRDLNIGERTCVPPYADRDQFIYKLPCPLYHGPEPVAEGHWWYLPMFTREHGLREKWEFDILFGTRLDDAGKYSFVLHGEQDRCRKYDPEMIVKKSIGDDPQDGRTTR